ncbi:MAG: hypothetical protein AAGF31_11595 [Planctomycetota bacterium]
MSSELKYEAFDADYSVTADAGFSEVSRPNNQKRKKPAMGRKRGKAPTSHNGMHRRRRRKMAW